MTRRQRIAAIAAVCLGAAVLVTTSTSSTDTEAACYMAKGGYMGKCVPVVDKARGMPINGGGSW